MSLGRPPDRFDAADEPLPRGQRLYRGHSNTRTVAEFNPGVGSPTRLAFFGDPSVPVVYAADTEASEYPRTVRWAQAAHAAGFDGLAWTSRTGNDIRAVVLFGDRCADEVTQDVTFARIFQTGPGLDWVIATCDPLHVDVLPPTSG